MDERLRRSERAGDADPAARDRRALELLRAGDPTGAADLVRGAFGRGDPVAAEVLDRLGPPDLEALVLREAPGALADGDWDMDQKVDAVAWWPDERGVFAVRERLWPDAVARWDLGGGPAPWLEPEDLRRATGELPDEVRTTWIRVAGLAVRPDGAALAVRFQFADVDGTCDTWQVRDALDGGPLARATRRPSSRLAHTGQERLVWAGGRLLAGNGKALEAWDPGGSGGVARVLEAPELDLAEGTVVARWRDELRFYRPGAGAPTAAVPLPIARRGSRWSGLVAASGARAVVCDRDGGRLLLFDGGGLLAEAPAAEPLAAGKLAAVRPCPSGWVAALRFHQKRFVWLVDLAGAARRVALPLAPRDLVWSPSGRALALPCRRGRLLLLEVR